MHELNQINKRCYKRLNWVDITQSPIGLITYQILIDVDKYLREWKWNFIR